MEVIELDDGTKVKPEEVQGMTLKGIFAANALQAKAIASSEATAARVSLQTEKQLQIDWYKIRLTFASEEEKAGLMRQLNEVMTAPDNTHRATEANSAAQGPTVGVPAQGPP